MIVEQNPLPRTANWPLPADPQVPFPWACEPTPTDTGNRTDESDTAHHLTGWPRVFPGL
jgi:hypothetical protein